MKLDSFLYMLKKKIESITNPRDLLTIRSLLEGRVFKRKICFFLSCFCTFNLLSAFPTTAGETTPIEEEMFITEYQPPAEIPFKGKDFFLLGSGPIPVLYSPDSFMDRDFSRVISTPHGFHLVPKNFEEPEENTEEIIEVEEPKVVTEAEKISIICEKYGLTEEEFKTIVGVVITEAKSHSYEDAYAVINTIFNRSISSIWIADVERLQGEGTGTSMYHQVIQYHQFDPYWLSGSYKDYMDATPEEYPGMQAVIDFLYGVPVTLENGEEVLLPARLHDFANFVGNGVSHKYQSYAFVDYGNNYGVSMEPEHYTSYEFTEISEAEVEARAVEVESFCDEYLVSSEETETEEETKNKSLTLTKWDPMIS